MRNIRKILFAYLISLSGFANASFTLWACNSGSPTWDFQGISASRGNTLVFSLPDYSFPIIFTTPNTYTFDRYSGCAPMTRTAAPTIAGSLLDLKGNLPSLESIPSYPQFLPYYLGNNLNGSIVGTLESGPLTDPTEEVRFGLVDDSGFLWASVTNNGSFNFNATPGRNYYGIVYGVVNSPTAYHANLSAVPVPSAIWLLGSALAGLIGAVSISRKSAL